MLLQVSRLSKNYGIKPIIANITFHINERDRIGLVGVNGAGKSTLLQIIAGQITADSGDIHKAKETRVGYLAQNSGLQSDLSIEAEMRAVFAPLLEAERELRAMEQQIAEMAGDTYNEADYEALLHRYASQSEWFREQGGFEIDTKIRSVLHGMGFGQFPPDTLIASLSGGQRTRLALARILLQSPDLLLLDEPTNHLDIATLTWLEAYLRSYNGALLVVSHDRYFLDALVGTIIEIERNQAKRYTGNYSRFIEVKAAEYEAELKQYEKQQDEISRMEDFVQRNLARASTTKRAQSRRKALERMDRLDKPQGELKRASFSFEIERPTGKDVLDLQGAAVTFLDHAEPLFRDVSFQLKRGETVALIGPNGIGKSTLLKALIGKQPLSAGSFTWGANAKVSFYDQEQTILTGTNTVLEEVWGSFPYLEEARVRTVLGNFLFSGEDVLKRVAALSGGEKARVALAKLMLEKGNILILDEPTNHLDLYSKEVLESALLDYEGTLLFISHDRYFLNKMAERIVELTPQGANHYLGNYDDMLEKKKEAEELRELTSAPAKAAAKAVGNPAGSSAAGAQGGIAEAGGSLAYEASKATKREERQKQRRSEQLEQEIARLEAQIAQLEQELADPAVYNDYVLVQEKQQAIDQARPLLEQAYEEWEQLLA